VPQIFSRTADTWFRAIALGALVVAHGILAVALAIAR
jgi:hypothetical protein